MSREIRFTDNYVWSEDDLIGEGAAGKVYRCYSKQSGQQFAVKVLNRRAEKRPTEKKMREFEILKKSCHPNIVQLVGLETLKLSHCNVLIMELCVTNMFDVIDQPQNAFGLNEKEFKNMLHDIYLGMEYLNQRSIVHRDIKPSNILRTEKRNGRYTYKLSDFDAAKELTEEDENLFFSICGTEEYVHPAIYEKGVLNRETTKPFSDTVDLWSLGATLYHLATGSIPFKPNKGREDKEIMFRMTKEKASGIISCHQDPVTSELIYLSELPDNICLSKSLRHILTPLLSHLLENNIDNALTYEKAFKMIKEILEYKVIDVFFTQTCTLEKLYLNPEATVDEMQPLIKELFDIDISPKTKFYNNPYEIEFKDLPSCTTTIDDPVYIHNGIFMSDKDFENAKLKTQSLPDIRFDGLYDTDFLISKKVAKTAFALKRQAAMLASSAKLFTKICELIWSKLPEKCLGRLKMIKDFQSLTNRQEVQLERQKKVLRDLDVPNPTNAFIEGDLQQKEMLKHLNELSEKIEDCCQLYSKEKYFGKTMLLKIVESVDAIETEVESLSVLYLNFRKTLRNPTAAFEDIHRKGERENLRKTFQSVCDNVRNIRSLRDNMYIQSSYFLRHLHEKEEKLENLLSEWLGEKEKIENNYEDAIIKFESKVCEHFKFVDVQFDWLLDNTPKMLTIVSNQQEALREMVKLQGHRLK